MNPKNVIKEKNVSVCRKRYFSNFVSLLNKSELITCCLLEGNGKWRRYFFNFPTYKIKWNRLSPFFRWRLPFGPETKMLRQDLFRWAWEVAQRQRRKSKTAEKEKCKNIWNSRAPSSCVLCFCKNTFLQIYRSISLTPHELSYVCLYLSLMWTLERLSKHKSGMR